MDNSKMEVMDADNNVMKSRDESLELDLHETINNEVEHLE